MRERQQNSALGAPGGREQHPTRERSTALGRWLLLAGGLHASLLLTWVGSTWLEHNSKDAVIDEGSAGAASNPELLRWVEVVNEASNAPEPSSPTQAAPGLRNAEGIVARSARIERASGHSPPRPAVPPEAPPSTQRSATPPASASNEGTEPGLPERPRLSLRELGVGAGNNPFLNMPLEEVPIRRVLNQRVQQMLTAGLSAHDQEVGLGPEGPAVALLETIVMASPTQPNTSALLSIRTDGSGRATHVELLEASNETAGWEAIAAELLRELGKKRLRVPRASSGVSLQLRVTSRVQLPSGADPGLSVELFGQNLTPKSGERSTKLSILSPKVVVTEAEIPYTDGRTMPVVGFSPNVLALEGDLVDIGAAARRVVRAHLVAMETHVKPAERE